MYRVEETASYPEESAATRKQTARLSALSTRKPKIKMKTRASLAKAEHVQVAADCEIATRIAGLSEVTPD